MPEYLAPGVFVEEIERGPKPIEGVATSTAAFLGETERGPMQPRLVTSYGEYIRLFGEVFKEGAYPQAMFSENGGAAHVKPISAGDNRGSGSSVGQQCRPHSNSTRVKIVIGAQP